MLMTYDFSVLRELRKKRKLTIADLSAKSGVSYVAISKLERNQGNPELKTLDRISRALQLPTHNLLALAEQKHPFQTKEIRCKLLDNKADCRHIDLEGLRVLHITAQRGATGLAPEFHRDDYEHCGKLKVMVRGSEYILGPGEALKWDCFFEHNYEALEPTTYITVLTPKRP